MLNLERFIQQCQSADGDLNHTELLGLAGLGSDEAAMLHESWQKVHPNQRRTVVDRLVQMAEDNVDLDFTSMFTLCLEDPDETVRQKAISGLWECEDRNLILKFSRLLMDDISFDVRAAAAIGLGNFAMLAVEGKLLEKDKERIAGTLLQIIRSDDAPMEVHRRALEAMAPFNTDEIQEMIQKAYDGATPELRCSALYAMGRSCDSRWVPFLLKELKSDEPAMRYEAANATGELGSMEFVPSLASLIRDEDYQVQIAAIQALGRIGGRRARRLLQAQIDAAEDGIVEAAQDALRQIDVDEDPLIP